MNYALLCMAVLLIIYAGQVFGLMMHCEHCNHLKGVRKSAAVVPLMNLVIFIWFLRDSINHRNYKKLFSFMRIPQKGLMTLAFLAAEQKNTEKTKKCVQRHHVFKRTTHAAKEAFAGAVA